MSTNYEGKLNQLKTLSVSEIVNKIQDSSMLPASLIVLKSKKELSDHILKQPYFPNGFESWHETHFEVVQYLISTQDVEGSISNTTSEQIGTGGMYELAKELTDLFEERYKGREWDGDYMDTIEQFLDDENKTRR